jgi:hypothetical protein
MILCDVEMNKCQQRSESEVRGTGAKGLQGTP